MSEIAPIKIRNVRSKKGLNSRLGVSVFRAGIDFEELDTERFNLMLAGRVSESLFGVRRPSKVTGFGAPETGYVESGESCELVRNGRETLAVMNGTVRGYFGRLTMDVCGSEELCMAFSDIDEESLHTIELQAGDYVSIAANWNTPQVVRSFQPTSEDYLALRYRSGV